MSHRVGPATGRNWDDISTMHNASRRTATYGEMSQRYGTDTAIRKVSHQGNGHASFAAEAALGGTAREAWTSSFTATTKTVIRDHGDSAAVRQCEEYQEHLSQRMAQADGAAKAVRNAQETINAETMLAQAKAEAEAWKHDKSTLASIKAAQNLSPLGVRAIIAERDALRYQLRKAAAELHKVRREADLACMRAGIVCLSGLGPKC